MQSAIPTKGTCMRTHADLAGGKWGPKNALGRTCLALCAKGLIVVCKALMPPGGGPRIALGADRA